MDIDLSGRIVLIGAGNMGGAVLRGWLDKGIDPRLVLVVDPSLSDEMTDTLQKFGVEYLPSVPDHVHASIVVLAIKPQLMDKVLPGLAPLISADSLIVSLAAGTTIATIKQYLPNGLVVRTMPNTPSMVGRGITGVFAETGVEEASRHIITELLQVCGDVVWLDDEAQIDMVTAVSGSGPAYVFLLAEVMAQAGIEAGLPDDLAHQLARATVSGAGELMHQSPLTPSVLRENVTSPGGTTAAALSVLMGEDGFQPLMTKAVAAAKKRSEELAQS